MKHLRSILGLLLCLCLVFSLVACKQEAPTPSATGTTKPGHTQHADANSDGHCDVCGNSVLVDLNFFAINDIHGKFSDTDSQPGVDELTTYFMEQENAILLSSGDTWQGSSESNLTYGNIMTDWMNRVGFAAMTLGNHEFDWGEEYIEANAELANFPLLAINVYDRDTKQRVEYCDASVMVERSGLQIGIIGAIGDCYGSIAGDKSEGVYFLTGAQLTQLVKDEATRLREAGADIVVYSIHDGSEKSLDGRTDVTGAAMGSYYDTSLSDGYVDLVFEGHIHKRYAFTDEYGVYHLQAGGENTGISHAQVSYNLVTGALEVTGRIISNTVYDDSPSSPIVGELLEQYGEQIAMGSKVLGVNGSYMNSDEIQALVAQLYYEAGVERWGQDYEIALAGAFIGCRSPYHIPAGEIKYSQIQSVLPFDNQIVLCSVRGNDLKNKFFETDNRKYGIYYDAFGEALRDNIDPSGTYYIITDTFTSSYGPNRLTVIAEYDANVFARDLIAQHIADGKLAPVAELTSIPDILTLGASLGAGETTKAAYTVKGTVVSIVNTTYGNMTIRDENGNELYIYGVNDSNGNRYDSMENARRWAMWWYCPAKFKTTFLPAEKPLLKWSAPR